MTRVKRSCEQAQQSYADFQFQRVARRKRFHPADALLLFSAPRGGSSWLAETLHHIPRTALVWEPLQLFKVPAFQEIGFGWRQHIPEEAEWDEARRTFEQLLQGELLNAWIGRRSSPRDFAQADQMLVKFIRASALLPWLTRQFAFRRAPIFLIRHPFAVAASQLLYFEPSKGLSFLTDRYSEAYASEAAYVSGLGSPEEVITARWCLINLPALRHPENNERWITLAYEDLLTEPERELKRIFDRWGMAIPPGVEAQVRKPSSTTNEATFQRGTESQLRKWQDQFSDEQIGRMRAVLDHFEVEFYDGGVRPLVSFEDAPVPCGTWA